MLAQALLEKGMLDSLALQASQLTESIVLGLQQRPFLWGFVGVAIVLLLLRRTR